MAKTKFLMYEWNLGTRLGKPCVGMRLDDITLPPFHSSLTCLLAAMLPQSKHMQLTWLYDPLLWDLISVSNSGNHYAKGN